MQSWFPTNENYVECSLSVFISQSYQHLEKIFQIYLWISSLLRVEAILAIIVTSIYDCASYIQIVVIYMLNCFCIYSLGILNHLNLSNFSLLWSTMNLFINEVSQLLAIINLTSLAMPSRLPPYKKLLSSFGKSSYISLSYISCHC